MGYKDNWIKRECDKWGWDNIYWLLNKLIK